MAATQVKVGDERTEAFPPLTRTMFVRYAGASGDFNPMHHDDTIATQVGNPSVFGHGMLTMGLAARVVKDWFGAESLRRLQVRFSKQVWGNPGTPSRAVCRGSATDVSRLEISGRGSAGIRSCAGARSSRRSAAGSKGARRCCRRCRPLAG